MASTCCVSWVCLTALSPDHALGLASKPCCRTWPSQLRALAGCEWGWVYGRCCVVGQGPHGWHLGPWPPVYALDLTPTWNLLHGVMSADAASHVGAAGPTWHCPEQMTLLSAMNGAVCPGVGTPSRWLNARRTPLQRHPEQTHGLGGEKLVPWIYSQMEKHRNMSKSDPSDS